MFFTQGRWLRHIKPPSSAYSTLPEKLRIRESLPPFEGKRPSKISNKIAVDEKKDLRSHFLLCFVYNGGTNAIELS